MPNPSSDNNLVLAIIAQNENRTLEAGSHSLGRDLMARGYRHHILDMMRPNSNEELKTLLASKQMAFAYGFAGVGSQFTVSDGTNLWTANRVPYLAIWHDHPCYNYRQHIVDSPYAIQGYHVRDHIEARNKYLNVGASNTTLLPVRYAVAPAEHCRPFKTRDNKIFYAKTGVNPQTFTEEWKQYPQALQDVLWALVEMAKSDRNLDLADATAKLFQENGQSLENLGLFMGAVSAVDEYIRAWRSDKMARALLKHPAHIVGRGWNYLQSESKRAEFFDPIPIYEYIDRIQNYRVIANTNPLWRDGVHERVYSTFCFGGISLTDRTQKSDEVFTGLPNYIGFDWEDDLEDVIATALHRASNDEASFFPQAEEVIRERVLYKTQDYATAIEQAVDSIHARRG